METIEDKVKEFKTLIECYARIKEIDREVDLLYLEQEALKKRVLLLKGGNYE